MVNVNKDNFKEVVENNEVVIMDFWAPWCGPCKALGAMLAEIEKDYPNVVIGKVNVDEEDDLAAMFQIEAIPFVVKFKNGKLVDKFLGLVSEEELHKFFND